MTLNKFMHPRNIYKVPPDFTSLAVAYPEFLAISSVGLNGRVTIDFKDENALRSLTRCLLLKDFDLDVQLPPNRLVPTLPLRLNYLLWLEDIFKALNITDVCGIDIGCGASCIYPLLAAKSKNWKMYAVEVDPDSFATAQQNVEQNHLSEQVQVIQQTVENEILKAVFDQPNLSKIVFCMCNPPFFDSDESTVTKNRSADRSEPKNAKTGSKGELAVEGGELKFVQKIIAESCQLKDKITVYTTMLGHKSSLKKVLEILRQLNIRNFTTTEFCQGRTMRWGIAWSFHTDFLLSQVPPAQSETKKRTIDNLLAHILPPITGSQPLTLSTAVERLKDIFEQLKIKLNLIKNIEDLSQTFEFSAYENTWSYQRRKRREIVKLPLYQNKVNQEIEQAGSEQDIAPDSKRIKLETSQQSTSVTLILEALICVENQEAAVQADGEEDNEIVLKISFIKGSYGKDGANQILQFLKNNWKLRDQ